MEKQEKKPPLKAYPLFSDFQAAKKRGEKKSPIKAAVLSGLVCPGAGQIYNGDRLKGYLLIAVAVMLFLFIVLKVAMGFMVYYQAILGEIPQADPAKMIRESIPTILLLLGLFGAVWIYSMVDAYLGGKE